MLHLREVVEQPACQAANAFMDGFVADFGDMAQANLNGRDIEVIDQKTEPLYVERMAGLGALIGPHFHHRQKISHPPTRQ